MATAYFSNFGGPPSGLDEEDEYVVVDLQEHADLKDALDALGLKYQQAVRDHEGEVPPTPVLLVPDHYKLIGSSSGLAALGILVVTFEEFAAMKTQDPSWVAEHDGFLPSTEDGPDPVPSPRQRPIAPPDVEPTAPPPDVDSLGIYFRKKPR